jgi:hypothetical protein
MSSIKVVVGFYSLLAVVEQTFAIAWPAGFQRVLSSVKAAFASVVDLSAFACAVHVNWFHKVGFWCLAMFVVLFAIAVVYAVVACKDRQRGGGQVAHAIATRRSPLDRMLDKLAGEDRSPALGVEYSGYCFNAMLLLYPFLSPAAVAVFNCRDVAGSWYLQADVSLNCFDDRWAFWAVISALICAFYVIGLPSIAFYSIIHGSASTAFISDGYRTDAGRICLGWEVVEMIRKLLLTSAVIFCNKGSCMQISVAMLVSMFFLAFHMFHMPYETPMDNWLQVVALVSLLLMYFMGLIIKAQPALEQTYGFDAILQVVATAVGMLVLVVAFVHKAGLRWRHRTRSIGEIDGEIIEPFICKGDDAEGKDDGVDSEQFRDDFHVLQEQYHHEKGEREREQEEREREQEERKREQEREQEALRFALQRAESAEGERAAMQNQLRHVQDQLRTASA